MDVVHFNSVNITRNILYSILTIPERCCSLLFWTSLQMAPNIIGSTFILAETAISDANNNKMTPTATPVPVKQAPSPPAKKTLPLAAAAPSAATKKPTGTEPYNAEIVWHNVVLFIILHSMALYGLWLIFAENAYLELIPSKSRVFI